MSGCFLGDTCASAASGHAVADPAIILMKSRRRIAFPKAKGWATVTYGDGIKAEIFE